MWSGAQLYKKNYQLTGGALRLKGHLGLVDHAQSPPGGVKQLTNKVNRGHP